jgi:hypothetical protein|uniref:Uncharacterized protein n=1 Tax=viral metagenome TaxID=1070528 RepID=A0A6C0LYM0_9ZZZZ
MAKNNTPIRYDKLEINNVVITEPEDNEMVKAQKLSYPRYKNETGLGQLIIKTPMINIFSGGIPSLGEYFKDDKSRAKNFKVPFDEKNIECKKFMDTINNLDKLMNTDKFRNDVMNGAKNLEYQPIIRIPLVDEDDDSKPVRPPCMKVYISLDYNTDKVQTQLFIKNDKGQRELTKVDTLDDLAKFVRYKSNVRMIIMANKFYVMKNPDPKTKKKSYGMTFKVMQIEVEAQNNSAAGFDMTADNFGSDDEDNVNDDVDDYKHKKVMEEIKTIDLDEGVEDDDIPKPKTKSKKGKSAGTD